MKRDFAALRFTEDPNLADRVYWYLAEFPLALGERVLAPVGSHDRLQAARVERTLSADEKDAPYDLRLIKRVAAKYGARKLVCNERELLEFGGVRYDGKHYTPFGKLLLAKEPPELPYSAYGAEKLLAIPASDPALYLEIARTAGVVLLFGEEGEKAFRNLYALLREESAPQGIDGETLRLLTEKLR